MTRKELIKLCLEYPNTYEDYPFDEIIDENAWTVMRHRGNKKSFAFIYESGGKLIINLKCNPEEADFFRSEYKSVTPAYHMNKTHCNSVETGGDVPEGLLLQMLKNSYDLTKPKNKI